jgi:hypothetical protein
MGDPKLPSIWLAMQKCKGRGHIALEGRPALLGVTPALAPISRLPADVQAWATLQIRPPTQARFDKEIATQPIVRR